MTVEADLETAAAAVEVDAAAGSLTEAQREIMRKITKRLSRALASPQVPV